ncbi:PID-CTERM protein-sorting domain-containing protein [Mariniflexile sp.]|uniref:PID-CTERM protein-sorting domain-containing protein n=1 Tax=Mariniflexile sp. TaxID=1979402 RepID=UPI004047D28C
MTIQNKRILASILFVLISFVCTSQVGGAEPPPPGAPPPGLPIDGGVLLALGLGLFYGAKKLFFGNKKS